MDIFAKIFEPLINLFLAPVRTGIFTLLSAVGLLGFTLFIFIFQIFKIIAFDLNNYVMFGLKPSDDFGGFSTPRPYIQFLIVSAVLWLINFFMFLFRFAKTSEAKKANEIFVSAIKATFGGIIILILFQVIILFMNILFVNITRALITNGTGNYADLANNIIISMFPIDIQPYVWKPFVTVPNSSVWVPNFMWGLGWQFWWGLGSNQVGYAFTIGLGILVVGLLISLPLIFILFDIVGKVFINWLLFISFPLIPAFSINDGGKRMKIWKEKYFGNLLAIVVYAVGISFLGSFVTLSYSFVSKSSLIANFLNILILTIILIGACFALKKLSKIAVAFVNVEIDNDQVLNTAKTGLDMGTKFAKSKGAKAAGAAIAGPAGAAAAGAASKLVG